METKKEFEKYVEDVKGSKRLTSKQENFLKTLIGMEEMSKSEVLSMGFSKRTAMSLKHRNLVTLGDEFFEKHKKFRITEAGKSLFYSRLVNSRPEHNSTFVKLVCFDLDDTLVSGHTNKNVDEQKMKMFLQILRTNGVHTAVLSLNPNITVWERLVKHDLWNLFDCPYFIEKGDGAEELKTRLGLTDDEIVFYGHDVQYDYNAVRRRNKKIKIIFFRDSFSSYDSSQREASAIKEIVVEKYYDGKTGKLIKVKERNKHWWNRLFKRQSQKIVPTNIVQKSQPPKDVVMIERTLDDMIQQSSINLNTQTDIIPIVEQGGESA